MSPSRNEGIHERLNVFIGENGAGKSNVLEAIALASAACVKKLDNEFLASRGIRVTAPAFMRAAFETQFTAASIVVSLVDEKHSKVSYTLNNDNAPYSKWTSLPEYTVSPAQDMKLIVDTLMSSVEWNKLTKDEIGKFSDDARHFASVLEELVADVKKDDTDPTHRAVQSSDRKIDVKLDSAVFANVISKAFTSLRPTEWDTNLSHPLIFHTSENVFTKALF